MALVLAPICLVAVAAVPVPLPSGLGDLRSIDQQFLASQWQVVGSVAVLSVAFVSFAFEVFSRSRASEFHLDFTGYVKQTLLDWALVLGAAAVVTNQLVLAIASPDKVTGSYGWPGLWAAILSIAAIVFILIVVFVRVVRTTNDEEWFTALNSRLEKLSRNYIERQLIEQNSSRSLEGAGLNQAYIRDQQLNWLNTGISGTVRDVRINSLRRLIKRIEATEPTAEVELRAAIGSSIESSELFIGVPTSVNATGQKQIVSAFRVSKASGTRMLQNRLSDEIDRLRSNGMQAIRESRDLDWIRVGDAYERLLLGMVMYAHEHGVEFSGDVVRPDFFGRGPIQEIVKSISDQVVAAVDIADTSFALDVVNLPSRISRAMLEYKADDVIDELMGIYTFLYGAAAT